MSQSGAVSSAAQLQALLHNAGLSMLGNTGWIRITGADRVRWLNGMVTNSIQDLQQNHGCYNFLLSAQGRIQGDAYIFAQPDSFLLETASGQISALMSLLDRFIIMDDVELADISGTQSGLSIVGPHASLILEKIGLTNAPHAELEMQIQPWRSSTITIIHAYSPLIPRFELWADGAIIETLSQTLLDAGAILCGQESQQWLRVLEGTPIYGTDIRDRELPQETGQARALHFSKGCYLGQEIVERIRSRGNVHRTFTGFRLEGSLPAAATVLEADGKQIGELTTIEVVPFSTAGAPLQLALGYARREALERGAPLQYTGGIAHPISLPFTAVEALKARPASESERV
ncbi:MAG TPA: folate-binding protein [Edaphobacter sp.]|nr:folate-binding protein [Edaphobacter sp.]